MRRLGQAAGISEEDVAQVRAAMGRQLRIEYDDVIVESLRRIVAIPGYDGLDVVVLRANAQRLILAILTTLEGGDIRLFGEVLFDIAYTRAKQGIAPRALFALTDAIEELLVELGRRCCSVEPRNLLPAAILARQIADSGRDVVIDAFQKAYFEVREAAEHLARQFSAPVLPALPGVLVLPIVGAVTPARADQIVQALLEGVVAHAARIAILDITGISDVDASLAIHLRRAAYATRLVGGRVVLVGVTPAVAQMLVANDVELAGVSIYATLAAALGQAAS